MSFLEIQFPKSISYGSSGGPTTLTHVKTLTSGHERRKKRWPYPRRKYNAAIGVRTSEHLEELIEFFTVVDGMAYGFRYYDPLDHSTAPYGTSPFNDVTLIASASGGEQNDIQLFKSYTRGGKTVQRSINKPISGTMRVFKNDVEITEGADYSVDYTTGLLSLDVALSVSDKLSWGGEFDVPCRFATDHLDIVMEGEMYGSVSDVPIVEVLV